MQRPPEKIESELYNKLKRSECDFDARAFIQFIFVIHIIIFITMVVVIVVIIVVNVRYLFVFFFR